MLQHSTALGRQLQLAALLQHNLAATSVVVRCSSSNNISNGTTINPPPPPSKDSPKVEHPAPPKDSPKVEHPALPKDLPKVEHPHGEASSVPVARPPAESEATSTATGTNQQDFAKQAKQALQGSWAAAVTVYRAATGSLQRGSLDKTSRVTIVRVKATELLGRTKQLVAFPKVAEALDQLNAVGPAVLTQPLLVKWDAFWQNYGHPIRFGLVVAATYGLWGVLDQTATWAFGSGAVPDYMTLAPAGLCVGWLLWYVQQRYVLDPETVYHLAMSKLSTNAGVLEVMGSPLAGSSRSASLVTGGGWQWSATGLRLRSKRVHLIFPLRGSERRGLACVEAKKLSGKIRFKLLSIDVPVEGGEERVFVVGDETVYHRGDIFQELRTPFVKAILAKQQYDAEDETDITLDYIEGAARQRKQTGPDHAGEAEPATKQDEDKEQESRATEQKLAVKV